MTHYKPIAITKLGEVAGVCLSKCLTVKLIKWKMKISDLLDFFKVLEFLFGNTETREKSLFLLKKALLTARAEKPLICYPTGKNSLKKTRLIYAIRSG